MEKNTTVKTKQSSPSSLVGERIVIIRGPHSEQEYKIVATHFKTGARDGDKLFYGYWKTRPKHWENFEEAYQEYMCIPAFNEDGLVCCDGEMKPLFLKETEFVII